MAVEKTYQVASNGKILTLHAKVDVEVPRGETTVVVPRNITFKGSLRPRRRKGVFTTSEPALIIALDKRIENAERAGKRPDFIVLSEKIIPNAKVEKTPEVVETKDGDMRFETEVKPHEIVQKYQSPAEAIGGITTVQGAKKYLLEKFDDLTTRDVSNKENITKVAQKKNILFVDMQ